MKKYILFAIVLLTFSSCRKWLDVKPVSQVSEEDLFKTPEGFEESLNGIYTRCAQKELYGFELTGGLPEALAQNYTFTGEDYQRYQQTADYSYKDGFFIARKDAIWNGLYNAIANCNLLLYNLDAKKEILPADRFALIKAEALALRGYLHFDLLRLFGPSFKSNPSAKSVPYVTDFSNKVAQLLTVTEVLSKIITDLSAAKELIRPVDPIVSAGYRTGYNTDVPSTEESSQNLFLQNRRHRMNYYAICAELARVNLYMDKKNDALNNAAEVIASKKFPWTATADFIDPDPKNKDRILYKEQVFAWYIPALKDTLDARFNSGVKSLFIEENAGNTLYETGGVGAEDVRFKQWFKGVSGSSSFNRLELQKYLRDNDKNRHYLVAPAIRYSEMFYIAAECLYDTDPVTALALLNTVRYNRGMGIPLAVANKDELIKELVKDARKEFYAEGQIFYMYKRLHASIAGQRGSSIPPSDKIFVLPLPDNEIEFGNR
ncbi:hypothetical protein A3860_22215 [Niastella vici]|uniref:Carbohydrate-binding protein SusD n=1 Tax=Niastella vici TaxID=1703345 RepID=A0A1V9G0J7_9BACT|nr:RagB/SusD family nutrient uptake outer membrane protein [Niastella vici]OQP64123.1 hypothetical protein A3860_22215 [Niastella vici]